MGLQRAVERLTFVRGRCTGESLKLNVVLCISGLSTVEGLPGRCVVVCEVVGGASCIDRSRADTVGACAVKRPRPTKQGQFLGSFEASVGGTATHVGGLVKYVVSVEVDVWQAPTF